MINIMDLDFSVKGWKMDTALQRASSYYMYKNSNL
jgi:hypothetical protein